MKLAGILVWLGLAFSLLTVNATAQYYYSDGRQIPLLIDSGKVTIAFKEEVLLDTIGLFADNYDRIDSLIWNAENIEDFRTFALNSADGYDEFVDTLRNDANVRRVNPYYMYAPGKKLLVGESFCCKFHESTTYEFIDSLNSANNVEVVYEKNYAPKEYLLRLNDNATSPTLDVANSYYELDEVEYSHPDFLGGSVLDGTPIYDYYWWFQWAMQRVFTASQAQPQITAFDITAGSPDIVIAVLDDGVAPHEDLPASRLLPGYDFACGDDTPLPCDRPGWGYHGMACAGIIGAGHTVDSQFQNDPNTGVCGVAPECKILPIKTHSSAVDSAGLYPECCRTTNVSERARAIDTAWIMGADIISNSWHYETPHDAITFAVIRAAYLGREWKGCGIFHSTGNYGHGDSLYPNNLEEVISVGAINPVDHI